ncbi:MAG: sensor histidine kinase [Lachnospiraceae bacterium]
MQGSRTISIQKKLLFAGLISLFLAIATVLLLFRAAEFLYNSINAGREEQLFTEAQNNYPKQENGVLQISPYYGIANNYAAGANGAGIPAKEEEMQESRMFWLLAVGILLVSVLFAVYFWLLTGKYMRYLKELSDGIRGFAGGRLENRVEVRGNDELGMIAANLNTMADDLRAMIEHDRSVETRKTELVTNVAHDLRTPLTSILGYLGLANREDISEEQRRTYVNTAYEKAKRLEKLVEDLFEYSKMTLGAVRMDCQELDLIRILQQLLEEFYPSFTKNGLALDFYYTDKNAYIYADGNLLARAFANLIGNAIKYGSDGKRVELSLQQTTEEVTVRIINFGEIIPKEALENIFERFYRVESSRSAQTGGSGLGLTIAKSVIEMHHGTIEVTSDLNGTVFQVTLPKKYVKQDVTEESGQKVRNMQDTERHDN